MPHTVRRVLSAGALAVGLGLALPAAAAAADVVPAPGSQVPVVPLGGSATGGGAPTGSTDSALLIGVGIAALAGAAGLFAAAQHAARNS